MRVASEAVATTATKRDPRDTRVQRGFTLIELLTVVALISIMLAIAVPNFTSFISNYRATAAVNEVIQGVTLTRSEALKRGRRVTMLPNLADAAHTPSVGGSWTNGWTVFVDMNNNLTLDSSDVVVYRHPPLAGSTISAGVGSYSLPFRGNNYVAFDGTGYPRQTDGTQLSGGVVFTDTLGTSTNRRTLCLAVYGRPRVVVNTVDPCTS